MADEQTEPPATDAPVEQPDPPTPVSERAAPSVLLLRELRSFAYFPGVHL